MTDMFAACHARIPFAAGAALLAALMFLPLSLLAAGSRASAGAAAASARTDVIHDFAALAKDRPKKCTEEKEPAPRVRGWRSSEPQCVWQNRLLMRQWEAPPDRDGGGCLSRQAQWWDWMRVRAGAAPAAVPRVWNRAWPAQSLQADAGALKRIALIERTAQGAWVATEWIWDPSPRMATRQWQAARWKLLGDAAAAMRQSALRPAAEALPLLAVWEKSLKGRAAEIVAQNWLWERDGLCLRMETVGLSQAQLHLPYSREDGRLEQRAAMQVRLARTYPQAIWLTPFRLLPLPDGAAPGGAKYEAIWTENAALKGQLWIPSKADGPVLRARIAVALPPKKKSEADAAAATAIARSVERELIGLANTWASEHEQ